MTLATEVTGRISGSMAIQLTNPDLASATAVDSTRLTKACDDAQEEFKFHVGVAFDVLDLRHVAVAVDLVILLLRERGGGMTDSTGRDRERIEKRLEALAKTQGRDRIEPAIDAGTHVTFETSRFRDVTLDPPQTDAEREGGNA